MAIPKTVNKNTPSTGSLNMRFNMTISGILAPAPPIIRAITAPRLMPFWSRDMPMGTMVPARTTQLFYTKREFGTLRRLPL
jgi:hypothetical protein